MESKYMNTILARLEWRDYDVNEAEGFVEIEANGELNYGISEIADELATLRRVGLPYMASDQAKYEIPGETTVFLPSRGGLLAAATNGDGFAMDQGTVLEIAGGSADLDAFMVRVTEWFNAFSYEAFRAEPLPAAPLPLTIEVDA